MTDLQTQMAQSTALLKKSLSPGDYDQQLAVDIAQFYDDPYGFVMYAFPWGQPGTDLEAYDGPDTWQRDLLMGVAHKIQQDPLGTIREATASGHSVGKTACTAWIILWAMSTRPHLAGRITANTQGQLKATTWRELALWLSRAVNKHWFEWTATRIYQVDHPETWGLDAIPWSEHNSEAFAGLHAEHVLIIFDEASAIADIIWEVSDGAMTTPRAMWFCFGNPTRNTGRFRQCFGEFRHRWNTRSIDSRTCKMAKRDEIDKMVADHGEDSDYVRVRVRGMFPNTSSNQLISSAVARECRERSLEPQDYIYQPIHIGCDPARFGDDETVISARQGRKHLEMKHYRGLNNMQVGALVARMFNQYREQGAQMGAIYVDGIGLGGGVVDYLSTLGYPVIDVQVGAAAEDKHLYFNKRVEMWVRLKEWLEAGADILDDSDLESQLTGIEYRVSPTRDALMLERKEELKARGLASPDRAESLALTFAEPFVSFNNYAQTPGISAGSFEPDVV